MICGVLFLFSTLCFEIVWRVHSLQTGLYARVHWIETDLRIAHSNCCTSREFVPFASNERKCSIVAAVEDFITSFANRCSSGLLETAAGNSKGGISPWKW